MKADQWMPLYVGDYLRDTGHLTTAEHGAYLLLLMQAWTRGGALPADDDRLRALARMSRREWARAREAVLAFFTSAEDGTLRNRRLELEVSRSQSVSEMRQAAGRAGANKRWKINGPPIAKPMAEPMANASQNDGQPQPQPQPQRKKDTPHTPQRGVGEVAGVEAVVEGAKVEKPAPKPDPKPDPFDAFWSAYPRKVGKDDARRKYAQVVKGGAKPEEILAGLKRTRFDTREAGRFIPHPATWLHQGRWQDQGLDLAVAKKDDDEPVRFAGGMPV